MPIALLLAVALWGVSVLGPVALARVGSFGGHPANDASWGVATARADAPEHLLVLGARLDELASLMGLVGTWHRVSEGPGVSGDTALARAADAERVGHAHDATLVFWIERRIVGTADEPYRVHVIRLGAGWTAPRARMVNGTTPLRVAETIMELARIAATPGDTEYPQALPSIEHMDVSGSAARRAPVRRPRAVYVEPEVVGFGSVSFGMMANFGGAGFGGPVGRISLGFRAGRHAFVAIAGDYAFRSTADAFGVGSVGLLAGASWPHGFGAFELGAYVAHEFGYLEVFDFSTGVGQVVDVAAPGFRATLPAGLRIHWLPDVEVRVGAEAGVSARSNPTRDVLLGFVLSVYVGVEVS